LHDETEGLTAGSQPQVVNRHGDLRRALACGEIDRLVCNAKVIVIAARVAVPLVCDRAGVNRRGAGGAGAGNGERQMPGIFVRRRRIRRDRIGRSGTGRSKCNAHGCNGNYGN